MVGESTALDRLLNAVLDCLLAGRVEMVEVWRESLGRLGVSGRGVGMMDIIASAVADDEVGTSGQSARLEVRWEGR